MQTYFRVALLGPVVWIFAIMAAIFVGAAVALILTAIVLVVFRRRASRAGWCAHGGVNILDRGETALKNNHSQWKPHLSRRTGPPC